MSELLQPVLFDGDFLMVVMAAWLLLRAVGGAAGVIGLTVGWVLAMVLLVVAGGEVAGGLGIFGPGGFLSVHAVMLAGLAAWRRRHWSADGLALRELGRMLRAQFQAGGATAWLGLGLLLVLSGQLWLALRGWPVVFDALTYRLPRIALWLQDSRLVPLATDDARLNFMPVAPDLVMAWLLGAHDGGYAWVALAQTAGGVLLVAATAGMARETGLARAPALGAAALLFGLANVVPQFSAPFTDLFAAGVFSAAFYLWLHAWRRCEASVLAGAGLALAFASKGTLFYLAPGLLLIVGWVAWRHRRAAAAWRATLGGALVAGLIVLAPGMVRNFRAYGGVFGPRAAMLEQHGRGFSPADNWRKLRMNLVSTLAQLLEPNAQPPGLRELARSGALALAKRLPESDADSFEGLDRRAEVEEVAALPAPDGDVASCGGLIVALFGAGLAVAARRPRRPGAEHVLLWGAGTVLFVLCLYSLLQWHAYSFRFWVLVAPWLTVVAAWVIEVLPRWPRRLVWLLVAACTVSVGWRSTMHSYQSGWAAAAHPENAVGFSVFVQTRGWLRTLEPSEAGLEVALPTNRLLAAFLRGYPDRQVRLRRFSELPATAREAVRGTKDWLVVPARRFAGRDGGVERRFWFFFGNPGSPFSLAAYRCLAP